jgi:hypothetical membrane protein
VTAVPLPARLGALSGIAAPASFITGWVVGGLQAKDYSPIQDAISQLARIDAPTRTVMTAGFLGFSAFAPFWATTLAKALDEPRLRLSLGAATVGTFGVAVLPLGASFGDGPHAAAAGVAYVGMASAPLVGGRALARAGHRSAARASYAVGGISVAALVGSLTGVADGGLQRLGLTVVDAWFVVLAVRELRRRA